MQLPAMYDVVPKIVKPATASTKGLSGHGSPFCVGKRPYSLFVEANKTSSTRVERLHRQRQLLLEKKCLRCEDKGIPPQVTSQVDELFW